MLAISLGVPRHAKTLPGSRCLLTYISTSDNCVQNWLRWNVSWAECELSSEPELPMSGPNRYQHKLPIWPSWSLIRSLGEGFYIFLKVQVCITYVITYLITYGIAYVITYVITYPYAWTVNSEMCRKVIRIVFRHVICVVFQQVIRMILRHVIRFVVPMFFGIRKVYHFLE